MFLAAIEHGQYTSRYQAIQHVAGRDDSGDFVEDPHRSIGWVGVAALVYFNVSGGPYGSEGLISACGPLPGLVAVIVFPLVWAFPLTLITAELSTSFPANGGYTIWVREAFGPFFGFQEGYWSWISGVVDNAVYPVLAMNYLLGMWSTI